MQYENIDDAWAVYAILSARPNEDPLKLPGLMELLIKRLQGSKNFVHFWRQ